MQRFLTPAGCLAVALGTALFGTSSASAKKPGGGGGGGGGDAPSYRIVALDDAGGLFSPSLSSGAYDVNEQGHVVGVAADAASGVDVPVFWQVDGSDSTIVPLAGSGFAYGLNNFNEIVGLDNGQALYWSGSTADPVELPPLVDGLATVAHDINDDGVICGWARDLVVDDDGVPIASTDVAVVWRVTYLDGALSIAGPVPLPTFDDRSQAYALNDNDADGLAHVVGAFMTDGFARTAAVQWTVRSHSDGTLSVDPDPAALEIGDAAAFGVNNVGASCGQALSGWTEPKAQVWFGGDGVTLNDPDSKPNTLGWPLHNALDLNDAGVVVGTAGVHSVYLDAVLWPTPTSEPVLLGKFLPKRNSPFAFLESATAVNEAGTIVGVGGDGAGRYGFLAVPQ